MTTINQAFIKVYRHDAAQPSPAGPPSADAARAAMAGSGKRPLSSFLTEMSGVRCQVSGDLPSPALTPTPHPSEMRNKIRITTGIAPDTRQPASDTRHPTPDTQPPTPDTYFQPATTTAAFHLPEVCRKLAHPAAGGEQLDHVADLLVAEAQAGRSLIGVIGLFPGCGATTITLCLAGRLEKRLRTIVVDGNFASPRLAEWLQAVPTVFWQDVLDHGAPLADAAVRAGAFDLLALGPTSQDDAVRLAGSLQAIVTAGVLRQAYDLVLIDAGAFLGIRCQVSGDLPSPALTPTPHPSEMRNKIRITTRIAPDYRSTALPPSLELIRNMGMDAVLAVDLPTPALTPTPHPSEMRNKIGITTRIALLQRLAEQLSHSGCELLGVIENRC